MSTPDPADEISVRPAALHVLAAELSVLAGELADDADLCRSTGHSFLSALGDREGWPAHAAARTWAGVQALLAENTAALARTLDDVAGHQAAHDQALAARIGAGRPGSQASPR